MMSTKHWDRYRQYVCECEEIGLTLDVSRMDFEEGFWGRMKPGMDRAFAAMDELEKGAIANPDEKRMVGHYWLRSASHAPTAELRAEIEETLAKVKAFAAEVLGGKNKTQKGGKFTQLLVIGIGGSALGPQFVAEALSAPHVNAVPGEGLKSWFLDNTDPAGMSRVLAGIGGKLGETLSVVISKSGSTPETRNGMLVARQAYSDAGLVFAKHAVAVTGVGSKLDKLAEGEGWLGRFAMWDWVGGRTSETSAVGLLPAALAGIDVDAMLKGAGTCDALTRKHEMMTNPAALLALMWFYATGGRGEKDMVVLPYRDSLLLFSRYLQQLVMESLGKETDLDGKTVYQGISVYGNKGSTDQHAYVQQLREGVRNFFVTFIEVLEDGASEAAKLEVEPGVRCGDYLRGFYMGTRSALHDAGRESMTITVKRVDAFTVGVLIALYERAVGLYATMVNINAYHQPGVEAGKKAAAEVLSLQQKVVGEVQRSAKPQAAPGSTAPAPGSGSGSGRTAEEVAGAIGAGDQTEAVYLLLRGLAANGRVKQVGVGTEARFVKA
ncbi:MAG: glucose-6-phosphate isomerase [Phycisphaerales bacterium]